MRAELDCAGAVKLALCEQVRLVRELWCVMKAQILCFLPNLYLRLPPRPYLTYAKKTALAVWSGRSLILQVLRPCNATQVAQSVIGPIPVDVVNITGRDNAIGVEPRKPVSTIRFMVYSDYPVSVGVRNASLLENTPQEALKKHASLWVVVKQFAQACCGKIGLSHDVSPVKKLIGQKPARVISTGGLRHFITRACSGPAEITKCLHQVACKAAGVCMPTNHCGPFHPHGASAPFNAL